MRLVQPCNAYPDHQVITVRGSEVTGDNVPVKFEARLKVIHHLKGTCLQWNLSRRRVESLRVVVEALDMRDRLCEEVRLIDMRRYMCISVKFVRRFDRPGCTLDQSALRGMCRLALGIPLRSGKCIQK